MFRKLFALICALSVVACVSIDKSNPSAVSSATKIEYDKYTHLFELNGPQVSETLLGPHWFIRGRKTCNSCIYDYQIYVFYTGLEWLYLNQAYSDGEKFEVVRISRNRSRISRENKEEHIGILLEQRHVAKIARKGLDIKVIGKGGSVTLYVPPEYMRGILDAAGEDVSLVDDR